MNPIRAQATSGQLAAGNSSQQQQGYPQQSMMSRLKSRRDQRHFDARRLYNLFLLEGRR